MAALFVPLLAGAAADDRTALERATLFFGTYTNGIVVRLDPPNRTVFNYLVSYELETDAVVRYPMKLQRIPVRQIAAVAQQDRCGDAGFAGVPKAVRALSADESAIVRFNDKRNTPDLDDAVKQLKAQAAPIEAAVTVPDHRAAAKFIEKTRDLSAGMIYTAVPADVQGTALGPQLDTEKLITEKLINVPANMRNPDLGAGTTLNFGRAELQVSPTIWGNAA
jgi:branched-chain amino acid transport system substrate-binding protein